MNGGTYDAPPPRRLEPPAPQLVETYWRAVGPSRKELSCGLYRTAAGLELRCGYSIDDLLRSRRIGQQDCARHVAAGWLQIALTTASFRVTESGIEYELAQVRELLGGQPGHPGEGVN